MSQEQESVVEVKDHRKSPIACLIIGMAGTGKSTLTHRLGLYCEEKQIRSFFINLDPAVLEVPYGVNIDIRDTIDYTEVMRTHKLGPNGAILTALNLFSTQFNEVVEFLEENQENVDYVFLDTPGQIEVFTWSASGQLITQVIGATFPTVMLYVIDGVRCSKNPQTFMSSILYATSVMYRSGLPMILLFNKSDICDTSILVRWMTNPSEFEDALLAHSTNFASQLSHTMSLMLNEFYLTMKFVSISASEGNGMEDMFSAITQGKVDYYAHFEPSKLKGLIDEKKRIQQQTDTFREDHMASLNDM